MSLYKTDTATNVRKGEEIDLEKLNLYLSTAETWMGEIIEVTQFAGGFSNLTYCLKTVGKEYVLRRPPFGANIKSAHDMGREFKVLSLLKGNYNKVPQPVIYCEDAEVMGAPFYIMERIEGVILRAANAPKMQLPPEIFRACSEALIDNLVALHSLNIETTGLIQLGKPEGYVQRQVEGWIKRYYNSETDKIESLDTVATWLKNNLPAERYTAFIHNDYKYDNVVLNPDNLADIIGQDAVAACYFLLRDASGHFAFNACRPKHVPRIDHFSIINLQLIPIIALHVHVVVYRNRFLR